MPRWRFFAELANRWNSNVRGRGDFGSHKRRTDGVSDFVFLRNERRSGRNAKLFSRAQPRGPGPRPSQPRRAFVRPRVFAYRTALPALAHPPSLAPCRLPSHMPLFVSSLPLDTNENYVVVRPVMRTNQDENEADDEAVATSRGSRELFRDLQLEDDEDDVWDPAARFWRQSSL